MQLSVKTKTIKAIYHAHQSILYRVAKNNSAVLNRKSCLEQRHIQPKRNNATDEIQNTGTLKLNIIAIMANNCISIVGIRNIDSMLAVALYIVSLLTISSLV